MRAGWFQDVRGAHRLAPRMALLESPCEHRGQDLSRIRGWTRLRGCRSGAILRRCVVSPGQALAHWRSSSPACRIHKGPSTSTPSTSPSRRSPSTKGSRRAWSAPSRRIITASCGSAPRTASTDTTATPSPSFATTRPTAPACERAPSPGCIAIGSEGSGWAPPPVSISSMNVRSGSSMCPSTARRGIGAAWFTSSSTTTATCG